LVRGFISVAYSVVSDAHLYRRAGKEILAFGNQFVSTSGYFICPKAEIAKKNRKETGLK